MERKKIRLAQGEISYLEAGRGAALLFLHGAFTTSESYVPLLALLSQHYHIIAPVHPGHGSSFVIPKWWKLTNYVLFYQDFLEELEFHPDVIIGHSFGGVLALLLAAAGYASRVIVMDAPVPPYHIGPRDFLSRIMAEAKGVTIENKWGVRNSILQTLVRHQHDITTLLTSAPKYNIMSTLKHISVPVELLWGEKDEIVPVQTGKNIQTVIPSAKLTVFPGLGHIYCVLYPEFAYKELVKAAGRQ